MKMLLTPPLKIESVSKSQEYDNKILVVFMLIMSFMIMMGLLFVDLTASFAPPPSAQTVEKPDYPKPLTINV